VEIDTQSALVQQLGQRRAGMQGATHAAAGAQRRRDGRRAHL
jgi:hypothetical protein